MQDSHNNMPLIEAW